MLLKGRKHKIKKKYTRKLLPHGGVPQSSMTIIEHLKFGKTGKNRHLADSNIVK